MKVFLSYTRSKDQFNAVSDFAKHLKMELVIRSPGSSLFHDTESIVEGEHFPVRLESEVKLSDVFLPLISPAWFASEWCRLEYLLFTSNYTDAVRLHRVLPILWVTTPDLQASSDDELVNAIKPIQYFDWRELRYGEWNSRENRREVGKLAERAVMLSTHSERTKPSDVKLPTLVQDEIPPGLYDLLIKRVYPLLESKQWMGRTVTTLAKEAAVSVETITRFCESRSDIVLFKDGERLIAALAHRANPK